MIDDESRVKYQEPVKISEGLNAGVAKRGFTAYDDGIRAMQIETDALTVENETGAGIATEMLSQAVKLKKELESKRKEVIKEPDNFVRSINGFVKTYRDQLVAIETAIKKKIGDYSYKQELERRKREQIARDAAAEVQKRMDAEAKAAKVEPVKMPEMVIPEKREPTRTDTGTTSTVMVWEFEVLNWNKLPRQYLQVNERAIRDAIKGGIRDIPGVRIFEKAQVKVRTY